ncbi:MAG: hypothetical protein ACXWDG_11280 [Aeromicrobium sp.]
MPAVTNVISTTESPPHTSPRQSSHNDSNVPHEDASRILGFTVHRRVPLEHSIIGTADVSARAAE